MLGSIGSRVDTERPGGALAAQADLTDVPTLAEGDHAYGQRRVALRASGFHGTEGIGQVEVDEHSAGSKGNRQAEFVGRVLGDSLLGADVVDEILVGGGGGDEGVASEIVEIAGQAERGLVEAGHGVIGE